MTIPLYQGAIVGSLELIDSEPIFDSSGKARNLWETRCTICGDIRKSKCKDIRRRVNHKHRCASCPESAKYGSKNTIMGASADSPLIDKVEGAK